MPRNVSYNILRKRVHTNSVEFQSLAYEKEVFFVSVQSHLLSKPTRVSQLLIPVFSS